MTDTELTDFGRAKDKKPDHAPLKVSSPRLEQDVFNLTPCAMPDRPDARRQDPETRSRRAVYEPDTDDGSEQASLAEQGDETR